jgi:hypothetical protein
MAKRPSNPFLDASFDKPSANVLPAKLPPLFSACHGGSHSGLLALVDAKKAEIEAVHPPFARMTARQGWPAFINARLDGETHYKALPGTHGGPSLLHLAAGGGAGHVEVVRTLLSEGADPHVVDDRGRLPLHLAAAAGNEGVVKLLLRAGCDVDARQLEPDPDSSAGRRRRSSLLRGGKASGDGSTALHLAAAAAHLECVRFLLFAGATPDMELLAGGGAERAAESRRGSAQGAIAEGGEEEEEDDDDESDGMTGTAGDVKDEAELALEAEAALFGKKAQAQKEKKKKNQHGEPHAKEKEKKKKKKHGKKHSSKKGGGDGEAPLVPAGAQRRRSSVTGLVPRCGALASDLARKVHRRRAEPARLAQLAAEDQRELIEMLPTPSTSKEARRLGNEQERLRELRAALVPLRAAELRALACADAIEHAVDEIFAAREEEAEAQAAEAELAEAAANGVPAGLLRKGAAAGAAGAGAGAGAGSMPAAPTVSKFNLKARLRRMSRGTVARLYGLFAAPHERTRHEHFVQRAENMRRRSVEVEHAAQIQHARAALADGGDGSDGGGGAAGGGKPLTDAEALEAALDGVGLLPLVTPTLLRKWGSHATVVRGPDFRGGQEKLRRGQRPCVGLVVGYRLFNGAREGDDPPPMSMCANVVWAGLSSSFATTHLIGRTTYERAPGACTKEGPPVHELRFAAKPNVKRIKPRLKAMLASQRMAKAVGFGWEKDTRERGSRGADSTGVVDKSVLLAERHTHARAVYDEDTEADLRAAATSASANAAATGAAVAVGPGGVDAAVLARLPAAVREKVLALGREEPAMAHVSTDRAKARVALLTKGRRAAPPPQVNRRASRLGSLVAEHDKAELQVWLADRLDKGRRDSVVQGQQEKQALAAAEDQAPTLLQLAKAKSQAAPSF